MKPEAWFKTAAPAIELPTGDFHFGDPLAEAKAALRDTVAVPLVQLGVIAVTGADAETFLQGQLSNDVRDATPERAQLTSFNSAKGRLLAVMTLSREPEGFALEVHRGVLDAVLKRLRMYVLRSKVRLEDSSASVALLGLAGKGAAAALGEAGLDAPEEAFAVGRAQALAVTRQPGKIPRFVARGSQSAIAALWPKLAAVARPVGTAAWRLLEIESGVPVIYPETQDRFVPQMCNLDTLGGISFSKGCYTGQEVVARVHYLGKVKRNMAAVRLPTPPPAPGTRIDAGEVVQAAPDAEGGSAALVVSPVGAT